MPLHEGIHPDFLGETARRIGLKSYPDARQFVVQHLYPDTLRLLLLLHEHVPIDCVVGIGYSGRQEVVAALEARGIPVVDPAFEDIERSVSEALGESLDRCERDGKRLVLHEVGGYAITALHRDHAARMSLVAGAVEVTKQGVWAAEALPELSIPQLNCAQTRMKEIEGGLVGEAVVVALDQILRELGYAVVGREALVLGYGWVGKGTAVSLRHGGMRVSVFDPDVIKGVEATVAGFGVHRSLEGGTSLGRPAIVIGASGRQSISAGLLERLPDRCFLVSGASKNHEIDLAALERMTREVRIAHSHVAAHELVDGRTLFLVNRGYPVNFTGSSVPDEIVEFLFSELIMLVAELLDRPPPPGIYPLSEALEAVAANVWLDLR